MCRTLSLVATVSIATMLCFPAEAPAQDVRAYEQRVDSLAKRSRHAQQVLAALEDSLRRNTRRYHTIVVAPLRVLTDSAASELAHAAARSVVATLTPTYGAALSALASHSFVVRFYSDKPNRLIFVGGLGSGGQEYSTAVVEPRGSVVASTLLYAAIRFLGSRTNPTLALWLGGAPQMDTASASAWTSTRVELLSAPATVGRRCYAGNIEACKTALGLVPTDDPATAWFDSTDRQRLLASVAENTWRNPDPSGVTACTNGSDTVCIALLRRFPELLAGVTLGPAERATLVQLATQVGGPRATERLLLTPGTPSERLAAAAGIPSDSVMRLWLGRVRDMRVASSDMSVGIAASSLVWVLACAALALRSSRWR